MPGYGTVGCFIFKLSVRAYQHGSHHGQGTESSGDHIAHHVAVIVLAGPDKAAFRANHPCNGIVDQRIEIGDPCFFKSFFVLRFIQLRENILETVVIGLADGILRGEPQILLYAQCVLEAAVGERGNGSIQVVQSLQYARALEFENGLADFLSVFAGKHQLRFSGAGNPHFRILIHVAIGMTGNGNGLFPGPYRRMYAVHLDRSPEHGTVQDCADRSVGALPHFLQVIFFNPLCVGSDRGALHSHAVLQRCFGAVHGHLVVGFIPVFQSQVVILGFQVHKRLQQFLFYIRPEDPGHFIPVHLHQRCFHLNLAHLSFLFP